MKKKRMVTALLTTAMVFGAVPTAFAADNITVTVDGQKVSFGDQQPVNINGRVMVPVRAVAEKMGWDVEWFTYYGNTVVDGQFQQEHDIVLKNIVKKSVQQQIAENKEKYPNLMYFDEAVNNLKITNEQPFYINKDNQVVVVFNQFEIAPGYM